MKKIYIIILIASLVILGIAIGIGILISNNNTYDFKEQEQQLADEDNKNNLNIIKTSSDEIKTSPNCFLIFNTYYKECKHTITDRRKISNKDVNKTKEQIQELYKNWQIENFGEKEIVFFTEKEGICNEHFIIKDENNYISIYSINEKEEEILEEVTNIVTTYLPQIDKENLKKGIKVVGREKLNSIIEDYE